MAKKDPKTKIVYRDKPKKKRTGISAAARAASEDRDIIGTGVAAFILGKLEVGGTLKGLPVLGGLDPITSVGIILYAAHRYKVGGKYAKTGATAALAVGMYRAGVAPPAPTVTGDGYDPQGPDPAHVEQM